MPALLAGLNLNESASCGSHHPTTNASNETQLNFWPTKMNIEFAEILQFCGMPCGGGRCDMANLAVSAKPGKDLCTPPAQLFGIRLSIWNFLLWI